MRSNRITNRPGVFGIIWLVSLAAASVAIYALLASYDEVALAYPEGIPELEPGQVVFVGSSLARFAMPSRIPPQGVLGDGRSCALLAVPGITQHLTTRLLEHAVEAEASTVFVEINAYAHEYMDLNEPALLHRLVQGLRDMGYRMSVEAKALLLDRPQRSKNPVRCGAPRHVERHLNVERLVLRDHYRFRLVEPSDPDALKQALERAREIGVEVIFFAPPRPQTAVDAMGTKAFADFQAHLAHTAARFGVSLWSSPDPWPDDHFMDIRAHAATRGRERFREQLARWYAEAP